MDKKINIHSKKKLYQGYFRVDQYKLQHSAYQGGWSPIINREVFERGNTVVVLPVDIKEGVLVLIEQFRIGAIHRPEDAWMLEAVAGIQEENESAEKTAHRELFEEVGLKPQSLLPMGEFYPSGGACTEYTIHYCALVDSHLAQKYTGTDFGEDIKIIKYSFEEAFKWLEKGKIKTLSLAYCLHWLKENISVLQEYKII